MEGTAKMGEGKGRAQAQAQAPGTQALSVLRVELHKSDTLTAFLSVCFLFRCKVRKKGLLEWRRFVIGEGRISSLRLIIACR